MKENFKKADDAAYFAPEAKVLGFEICHCIAESVTTTETDPFNYGDDIVF